MSDSKTKNAFYILSGLGVIAIGLTGAALGVLAIIDPAGTKLSDDADPFAPPPSRLVSAAIMLVFALLTAVGFWIVSLVDNRRS